ncbi:MAG TPA: ABC transporter permease [Chloroflexota bacterium]|nr:ABC transporter permease [Chloroflexota bacterium]
MSGQMPAIHRRRGLNWGRIALYVVCALVFLYLVAPILIVIPISFSSAMYLAFPPPGFSLQWYQRYFGGTVWLGPTALSLQIALVSAFFSTLLGVPAAVGLVRGRFPGRSLINALALAPMIIPEIIFAVAVFYAFAAVHLVGNIQGLIIAQVAVGIPFVVINVSSALYGVDERLERAAQSLGASPLRAFLSITLPLIRPAVLAGALFAFLSSWDDLLVPLFLSGPTSVTLPLKMWQGLRDSIDPTVSAASTLLIVVSTLLLLGAQMLRHRQERIRTRPIADLVPAPAATAEPAPQGAAAR